MDSFDGWEREDMAADWVMAMELFQQGYEYQQEGRWADAIICYKQSIVAYPTAEAYTFLGWTYSLLGLLDEAISYCHKAIEIDPSYGNPYNDIGAYLIELGQYAEAIPWLEKATRAPRYEARCYPYYNLGRVYEQRGDWRWAIECYKRAVEQNPDYELAKNAWLRLQARLN